MLRCYFLLERTYFPKDGGVPSKEVVNEEESEASKSLKMACEIRRFIDDFINKKW